MALYLNGKKLQYGSADRNYSETTLWSGSETPSTSGTQITLSDNISNYDEIVFVMDTDYVGSSSFLVSALTIGESYISTLYAPNYYGVFWVYDSDTQITIKSQSSTALKTYTKVVGIKYGNGTKTFHNYSTAEQVVGTWIDGSTIYEKTFDLGSDVVVKYDTWTDMDISATSYDKFISCSIINASGTFYPLMVSVQNANIYCLACRSGSNVGGRYLTIQYTKSST